MNDEVCEVVITGPTQEWLATFTRQLVDDRLAACGHIIPVIRSIYRWEGTVHDEPEARVALHTSRSLVSAIVARVDQAGRKPVEHACVGLDVVGHIVLRENLADPFGQAVAVRHDQGVPEIGRASCRERVCNGV